MAQLSPFVEHLLRRAGFGASEAEREQFSRYTYPIAVSVLTNFNPDETDVDDKIGTPGYVIVNRAAGRSRRTRRWPTRATAGCSGWCTRRRRCRRRWRSSGTITSPPRTARSPASSTAANATRLMAAKPSEDPARQRGQIELFRQYALGNFRELLIEVAKDPAMLYWLDGRLNGRRAPQENFGRELMELFTIGVENLRRDGRVCRGPRVHRLEPVGESHAGLGVADLPVQLRRHQPRHRGEGLQLPDLPRRRPTDSRARRRPPACRTGSI